MAWVSVGIGGATAIMGGIKSLSAAKAKKKAEREAANIKQEPLTNIADGLQVSTIGADIQKEQQARLAAGQVDAMAEGGSRSIIGGVGRVSAASQDVNNNISADLDQQQKNIDMVRAQDDARIRDVKEGRKIDEINVLSSRYNAANDMEQQGFGNMIQGAGMAASSGIGAKGKFKSPKDIAASTKGAANRKFGKG
jgi:hypothetical protein